MFGEKTVDAPKLSGWDFSSAQVEEARAKDQMLMLDAETSKTCDLRCDYCYRDDKFSVGDELTLEERIALIDHAKQLGATTIKIVGAGEPLVDKFFMKQLTYLSKNNITPIVFTNGMKLTEEIADVFLNLNASVILKFNSFNERLQDKFAGVFGYAKKRNEALDILMQKGFNKGRKTRLGIDSVITQENKKEILDIFRFCRDNNIFPMIKSFIPTGKAFHKIESEILKKELSEILTKAKEIDEKEYGIMHEGQPPYMGGFRCDQINHALFVNINGDTFDCPGQLRYLGNVRNRTLVDIWNSKPAQKIRAAKYCSCPSREEYWKSV